MRLGFVFIVLLMLGCTNKKETPYVQKQEISLAQPRVTATNTLIDSAVTISADLRLEGVQLFYTNDGSDPTQQSSLYTKPFEVRNKGTYTFRAFHLDWNPSESVSLTLFKKGIIPEKIDWITNAHPNYPDEDLLSLINQKKGSLNFRDVEWTGFDSIAKATVHFKKKTHINEITVGFLIDTKSWIFPPEEIAIYHGQNLLGFKLTVPHITSDLKKIESNRFLIGKEVDSITIIIKNFQQLPDWHPGKGNKAWMFLDEFIFNE